MSHESQIVVWQQEESVKAPPTRGTWRLLLHNTVISVKHKCTVQENFHVEQKYNRSASAKCLVYEGLERIEIRITQ